MISPSQSLPEMKSILKRSGFPFSVKIKRDGKLLGTIDLNFRLPNSQLTRNPNMAESIKRDQFEIITYLDNLRRCFIFYDLAFRFGYEIRRGNSVPYFGGIALFYLAESQAANLWGDIILGEKQIINHVKEWGPIALRSSLFFTSFQEWMDDPKITGKKLNQLKNALVEYAYQKPHKDVRWKQGRDGREVLRKHGTRWIRDMYRDLTSIFKLARRRLKKAKSPDIYEIIEESFVEHFYTMMNRYKAQKDDTNAQEKFKRIAQALESHRTDESENPIALIVESNKDLRDDILSFEKKGAKDREPNILAKRTIARMFGVSESKIKKIIEL